MRLLVLLLVATLGCSGESASDYSALAGESGEGGEDQVEWTGGGKSADRGGSTSVSASGAPSSGGSVDDSGGANAAGESSGGAGGSSGDVNGGAGGEDPVVTAGQGPVGGSSAGPTGDVCSTVAGSDRTLECGAIDSCGGHPCSGCGSTFINNSSPSKTTFILDETDRICDGTVVCHDPDAFKFVIPPGVCVKLTAQTGSDAEFSSSSRSCSGFVSKCLTVSTNIAGTISQDTIYVKNPSKQSWVLVESAPLVNNACPLSC